MVQKTSGGILGISRCGGRIRFLLGNLSQERFNLGVLIPAGCLVLEYQVSAHAATCEFFYTVIVLSSVGVGVVMPRAVVTHVLEKVYQPERRARIGGPEPEILIVAAGELVVEVDVEQLARLPGLSHCVG